MQWILAAVSCALTPLEIGEHEKRIELETVKLILTDLLPRDQEQDQHSRVLLLLRPRLYSIDYFSM